MGHRSPNPTPSRPLTCLTILLRSRKPNISWGGESLNRLKAGTVLYRVLWEGWPEELATWEEEDDIPCGEVDFVAQYDAVLEQTGVCRVQRIGVRWVR